MEFSASAELATDGTNNHRIRVEVPCSYDERLRPVRVVRWMDIAEAQTFADDILRAAETALEAMV